MARPMALPHKHTDAADDLVSARAFGRIDIAVTIGMILLWGFNIIAMKMLVEGAGTFPSIVMRQGIVALICLPFLRVVPGRMVAILIMGVLSGALFYIAIAVSLAISENVSALAIAGQLNVPFALVLAVIFQQEKIGTIRMIGIALGLGGVVLLVFDPQAGRELPGIAVSALGSLIWASSTLIQRRLGGIPVLNLSGWIGLIGTLVLLPVALLFDPAGLAAIPSLDPIFWGWACYAAIGSSIGGHGAMIWLLQRHDVATVSPLTIPTPVVSVAFATWWFGTPLTGLMIIGGLIALSGVFIVAVRNATRSRDLALARLNEEATRP